MKVAHDLEAQQRCLDRPLQNEKFSCNLPEEQLREFRRIKISTTFPRHATMFIEGQPSTGIRLLCKGRVKLLTNSRGGKALILRIAEPGEILGLSAVLFGGLHEATAEAIEPCQVNFVRRDEFIRFIRTSPTAAFNVIEQLNNQYKAAQVQIRSLGLSACVADKLAGLMLDWASHVPSTNGDAHIIMTFSHEEIGEMIGTSRETVTRLLKDFRDRQLITLKRSDLHILDKHLLEASIKTR